MEWQYTFYFISLLAGLTVMSLLAVHTFRHRDTLGAIPLGWLVLLGASLVFAEALSLLSPTPTAALFWFNARFIGLAGGPIAWLVFALVYSGRAKWLTVRRLIALFAIPLITQVMIWTNNAHGLWVQQDVEFFQAGPLMIANTAARVPGPWFWVHVAYSYLAVILGVILILKTLRTRADGLYRRQATLLWLGTILVLLIILPPTLQITLPGLKFNPTTLGAALAAVLAAWAIFHDRFLDLAPVARDLLIDSMDDGMLVVDIQDRIVDFNSSMRQLLYAGHAAVGSVLSSQLIGQPLAEVLSPWQELTEPYWNKANTHAEIAAEVKGERFYYDVRITPLTDRHGRLGGRVIVLRDITKHKHHQKMLETQNQVLQTLRAASFDLGAELKMPDLLRRTMERATDLLRADRGGGIFLYDASENVLTIAEGSGINLGREGLTLQLNEGVAGRVFQTAEPLIINDYAHWDGHTAILDAEPSSAVLGVPLLSRGQAIGVLDVFANSQTRTFGPDDVQLAEMFAAQVAIAIQNARLYEQVEEALHTSQAQLANVITIAADAVLLVDADQRIRLFNPSAERIFGYRAADVLGQPVGLLLPERFVTVHSAHIQSFATSSNSTLFMGEYREAFGWRNDGTEFPIEASIGKIEENNQPIFTVMLRDISERKRAEEALKQREASFRLLFANNPLPMWVYDLQTLQFLEVNDEAVDHYGYSRDEFLGMRITDIHPAEDVPRLLADVANPRLVLQHSGQWRHRLKDGRLIDVEITSHTLKFAGRQAALVVAQDVTERKRAEEALERLSHQNELILTSVGEGISGLNLQGNITFVNPAVGRMTGYTAEELIGRHQHDMLHHSKVDGSAYPEAECPICAAYKDAVVKDGAEELFRRKDGSSFPVEYISTPIQEHGELVGAVVLFRDITQRKQSEEDLKRLNRELEYHARELAALNKANQAIASTLELKAVLKLVMDEVRMLLNAEGASVLLYDQPRNELTFAAAAGPHADELVGTRIPATVGIAGWVLQHRQSVLVNDAQGDTRFYNRVDTVTGLTTRSILAVPLIAERMVDRGMIEVINKIGGVFDEHDLELLESMAHSASIAIENARLYRAEQQQLEFAETLREASATLVATLDVDAILDRLLEQVSRVVPNDAANIMLVDSDQARIARWRGYEQFGTADAILTVQLFVTNTPTLRQMVETGEPMFISDTHADPNWIRMPQSEWLRSYASVPIRVRGEIMGFLNVGSTTPGFFGQSHAKQLHAFADQAAIALENARLYQIEREQFDRLQQSQAQLIQAEKMTALGRMAATLAHEINNPLQAIQSHVELVMDFPLELEERAEYLRITRQEIERLSEITRRVLAFARPASALRQLVNVADLVRQTLTLASKKLQHSHIEVTTQLSDAPPVWAAPDQLVQVFLNLMINAIEAIYDHGCLRITLGVEEDQVVARFANDGPAIPPENLVRIFEPFFTTKEEGTGLGLSVSYNLVQQHGGTLVAENLAGDQGVVFTVRLPFAKTNDWMEPKR